jgi:hypothetical protein
MGGSDSGDMFGAALVKLESEEGEPWDRAKISKWSTSIMASETEKTKELATTPA